MLHHWAKEFVQQAPNAATANLLLLVWMEVAYSNNAFGRHMKWASTGKAAAPAVHMLL